VAVVVRLCCRDKGLVDDSVNASTDAAKKSTQRNSKDELVVLWIILLSDAIVRIRHGRVDLLIDGGALGTKIGAIF